MRTLRGPRYSHVRSWLCARRRVMPGLATGEYLRICRVAQHMKTEVDPLQPPHPHVPPARRSIDRSRPRPPALQGIAMRRDAVLRILEDAYRRPPGLASPLMMPGDSHDRQRRVGMAIRIDACAVFDRGGSSRRPPLLPGRRAIWPWVLRDGNRFWGPVLALAGGTAPPRGPYPAPATDNGTHVVPSRQGKD